MNHLKSSLSKFAVVASTAGMIACGGAQQTPPGTSYPGQSGRSSSDPYGATMPQANTMTASEESPITPPSSQNPATSGASSAASEYGPSDALDGSQSPSASGASGSEYGPSPTGAAGTTRTGAANTINAANLTDAQIAAVLVALNVGEIQEAQLAVSKAKSAETRRFAQRMLAAHRDMQSKDAALLSRLQITPTDTAVSSQLKTDVQNELSTLESSAGRDFDHDYIDSQVRAHNQALDLFDQMISSVKNANLRAQLQGARPKIAQHLGEAERIQETLQTGTSSQPKPSPNPNRDR